MSDLGQGGIELCDPSWRSGALAPSSESWQAEPRALVLALKKVKHFATRCSLVAAQSSTHSSSPYLSTFPSIATMFRL